MFSADIPNPERTLVLLNRILNYLNQQRGRETLELKPVEKISSDGLVSSSYPPLLRIFPPRGPPPNNGRLREADTISEKEMKGKKKEEEKNTKDEERAETSDPERIEIAVI